MKPIDLTYPAQRDMLQKLLDRPEVTEVRVSKGPPLELGVCRGGPRVGTLQWFPGATLFQALERAEHALTPRVEFDEDHLP